MSEIVTPLVVAARALRRSASPSTATGGGPARAGALGRTATEGPATPVRGATRVSSVCAARMTVSLS